MQKVSGTFIAPNATTCHLNLGFVPHYFRMMITLGGTEKWFDWWKILADKATTGQYGIVDDGAGAKTPCANAANGISAYDTQVSGVKVPNPAGITTTCPDGLIFVPAAAASATKATISDWSTSVNYNTGGQDRSSSVAGTCIRPTYGSQHINRIFELVTGISATGGTDTDIWNVTVGTQVTDCNGNIWICREEILCTVGCKGVTLGASIMTNSDICVYEAELHEQVEDKGDGDLNDPI